MTEEVIPETPEAAPETTPEAAAPPEAAPETTPEAAPAAPEPTKFWGRFADEKEAQAHYDKIEKDSKQASQFIESVTPFFDVDPEGNVSLKKSGEKADPQAIADAQREEYEKDPVGYVNKQVEKRQMEMTKLHGAELQHRQEFVKNHKADDDFFDEHLSEVDKAMTFLPPNQRANPNSYENVYNLVRSRNLQKIIDRKVEQRMEEQKKDVKVIEGARTAGASPQAKTSVPKNLPPLTEKERAAARGTGLTDEQYAKEKYDMAQESKHYS